LQQLIDKYGEPYFCKIDVEGFELEVLKGLTQSLPIISFEYCVPEMTKSAIACMSYLNSLSPNLIYNFSIAETMQFNQEKWVHFEDFVAVVQSKEFERTLFGDIYVKDPSKIL
jgi:hypothetical protein